MDDDEASVRPGDHRGPSPKPAVVSIAAALAQHRADTHLLVDVARDPSLLTLLRDENEEYASLFDGRQAIDMRMVAPYLLRCPTDGALLAKLLERAWGNHCLLFLTTRSPFHPLREHLQELLRVRDPEGKIFYFRYYDPRVLRAFLPSCDPEHREQIFAGGIEQLCVESEGGGALEVHRRDGATVTVALT